jgi:uncharacterized protein (TIGR02246 family)
MNLGPRQIAAALFRGIGAASAISVCGLDTSHAAAPELCVQPSRDEIVDLSNRWSRALASGNPQQVLDLYSASAVLAAQANDAPFRGKPMIQSFYEGWLRLHPQASVISHNVQVSCNAATDSGIVVYRITGMRKGTRMIEGGHYIMQYRLEDGAWRIVQHDLAADPRSLSVTVAEQN